MVMVEGDKGKKEAEKKGFTERKPKRLSEEEVAGIFAERRRSIIRRKEIRDEKRREKLLTIEKLIPEEEAEETTEEEFLRGVAKGPKIEVGGGFSGEGHFVTTDKKKKGDTTMSPALEDSAGVCYNEEKDVKINLSDDGKFVGASVNGTELNL